MKSPPIMYAYAAFLVICGFIAFAMAGFEMRAITGLIVGGGMGLFMVICGAMAQKIHTNRAVGMIGIHAGLVLPLVFAGLLAFQSYNRWETTRYLAVILAIMATGSVLAFIAILLTRPKPEARA